ncbi:hypothetical protein DW020_08240 [Clostridium sp. AF37-5AT]|jgi:hypothetical protein|nr:hypothetical protein DW020_08240 [Clostridium sp. AF37-5AT]
MRDVVMFLLGTAAGITGYKLYIRKLIHRKPCIVCDFCEFLEKRKNLWESPRGIKSEDAILVVAICQLLNVIIHAIAKSAG